jgi:DNA-binding transcriptional ArsR family regulator
VGTRTQKNALFDTFARMGKALSSGRRLEMLELLSQGERSVEQLAEAASLSVANASQHLQVLLTAGMVKRRRDVNRVLYRLAGDEVLGVWLALREAAAAQLGDVERAARDYLGDEVECIGREELRSRVSKGDVVVIDVRPRVEFEAGHIQRARSIPIDELERRMAELPDAVEVVAYCRGPYCLYAHDAVRTLTAAGRRARRLEEGWPEWRLATALRAGEGGAGPSGRGAPRQKRGRRPS